MRFDWVDEWVEQGVLTKEAGDRVNEYATNFLKEASQADEAMVLAKKLAPWVVGALGIGGMAAYDKYTNIKDRQKILENQSKIMDMFERKEDQEKAKARYEELVRVSPSAATNTNLSQSLVKTRLHSGLSASDHQRLAILEAHARKNRLNKGQQFIAKTGAAEQGPGINPKDEADLLAETLIMSKEAGLRDTFKILDNETIKNWAVGMGLIAGAQATLASIGGGVKAYNAYKDKKKLESDLEKSFETAIERSDPEKEPLRDNPEKARQAFQALAHFSPRVATQPDAARSFMSRIVSYDQGINAGDVRDLTEIEKNIVNSSKEHPFVSGFRDVARGVGFTGSFQSGMTDMTRPTIDEMKRSTKERQEAAKRMEIISNL